MLHRFFIFAWSPLISLLIATLAVGEEASPRFSVEVMAVLSKAGCNSGACHGNRNGKGGLKLSLRGEDAREDYLTLTHELAGRRVNRVAPEESLLARKPTAEVPHLGGQRFLAGSVEHEILVRWIAGGARWDGTDSPRATRLEVSPRESYTPLATIPLQVTATFSDGSQQDVAALACYEPSNLLVRVQPAGIIERVEYGESTVLIRFLDQQVAVRVAFLPPTESFNWPDRPQFNYIDRHVDAKLKRLRIEPSPVCDDATFLRRVFLDVAGLLPSAEEAQQFVADKSPDKRARLVNDLLQRREFPDFWAMKWSDLLRNEEKVLDRRGVDAFHKWIRNSIASDKPIDQFVREMLAGRGSTYEFPEANYYRANRDPFTRAETSARLFLGLRLQCAKCHNHPFDRWTQNDYYAWSAWFSRIDYQIVSNDRGDKFDKNAFNGEQIVDITTTGEIKNPRDGQTAQPKFLGAATPELADNDDRAIIMAAWLASRENKAFLKAQVNWIWYHLMGRGLVEPIDDVRETNPASHPELLEELADDFARQNCNLRDMIRRIVLSRAYQTSALPTDTNLPDEINYSRALTSRLPAEALLDAQSQVLGVAPQFSGYSAGIAARQIRGVNRVSGGREKTSGDRFLKLFGKPDRLLACECERSNGTTLNQALFTLSDEDLQRRLSSDKSRLQQWIRDGRSNEDILHQLYWTALTRAPSENEKSTALGLIATSADRAAVWQDFTWALLHSREFMFRH